MGIDNIYNTARKMKTNHYIKEEERKPKTFDNFIERKEWAMKQINQIQFMVEDSRITRARLQAEPEIKAFINDKKGANEFI